MAAVLIEAVAIPQWIITRVWLYSPVNEKQCWRLRACVTHWFILFHAASAPECASLSESASRHSHRRKHSKSVWGQMLAAPSKAWSVLGAFDPGGRSRLIQICLGPIHTGRRRRRAMLRKQMDLLMWMGVSTLQASNIKGKTFELMRVSRPASCVDWALIRISPLIPSPLGTHFSTMLICMLHPKFSSFQRI